MLTILVWVIVGILVWAVLLSIAVAGEPYDVKKDIPFQEELKRRFGRNNNAV